MCPDGLGEGGIIGGFLGNYASRCDGRVAAVAVGISVVNRAVGQLGGSESGSGKHFLTCLTDYEVDELLR
jgi:hypothetical protein